MRLSPAIRKGVLTVHLTASLGWLGSVAAYLVLAVAGLNSSDAMFVRGSYIGADLIMRFMIVPLSFGALTTGIVIALATPWGLFRHYWVVVTLVLNVFSIIPLLLHAQGTSRVARAAAIRALSATDLSGSRNELVTTAAAALVMLLVAMTLNVYKPRGLTPWGWRKQRERRAASRWRAAEASDGPACC